MSEKTVKFCSNIFGISLVMRALNILINYYNFLGGWYFDVDVAISADLIYSISCILIASALFASNITVLAVGCGTRALYLLLFATGWGVGSPYFFGKLLQAIAFILLTVSFLRKKESTQWFLIVLIIGVAGSLIGPLNSETWLLDKMAICTNMCSNTILEDYFPIFVGTLLLGNNAVSTSVSPVAVSHSQTITGDYFERINKLKELLDIGAITKEEFDAKKKELLGL